MAEDSGSDPLADPVTVKIEVETGHEEIDSMSDENCLVRQEVVYIKEEPAWPEEDTGCLPPEPAMPLPIKQEPEDSPNLPDTGETQDLRSSKPPKTRKRSPPPRAPSPLALRLRKRKLKSLTVEEKRNVVDVYTQVYDDAARERDVSEHARVSNSVLTTSHIIGITTYTVYKVLKEYKNNGLRAPLKPGPQTKPTAKRDDS